MVPWVMESCDRGVDVRLAHGVTAVGKDVPAPGRQTVLQSSGGRRSMCCMGRQPP